MSISGVFTTIINGFFTLLQIVLGAAIIAVPPLTMRKPPVQTKKLLMLLSIGAAGILILSSAAGFITQIITLSSLGALSGYNVLSLILSAAVALLGTILTLAFPLLVHMLKKTIQPLVFLLVIPVIQSIIVIVNSAAGFASTIPSSTGVIVTGILCGLLLIAAFVLFTVWYLALRSNRTFTLVVMIALPAVIGMSAGVLNVLNFRSLIFSNPMCMLLLLLFAMAVREFGIQKSVPPVPYNPGAYYPQN